MLLFVILLVFKKGVTIHFLDEEKHLTSETIEVKSIQGAHTGINLASVLHSIFDSWGIVNKGLFILRRQFSMFKMHNISIFQSGLL